MRDSEAALKRELIVDADGGDGAYATIQAAVDEAQAGDTITVRGGTYRETIALRSSGTAEAPITLRAADGADVMVKGSRPLDGFEKAGSAGVYKATGWEGEVWSWDERWTDGDPSNDDGDARTKAKNMLFVDGEPLEEVPVLGPGGALEPGQFHIAKADDGTHDVHVRLADDADPDRAEIELATSRDDAELLNTRGQDHWVVEGIDFSQAANPQQHFAAVRISGHDGDASDHITIRDISVTGAASAGLSMGGGTGHVVEFATLTDNGQLGFHGTGMEDSVVRYSEFARNNFLEGKGYAVGWEAGGAKVTRSDGLTFDNVYVHDNWGSGIWFDWTNSDAVLTNSVLARNKHGLHYEASDSARVYNNLFLESEQQRSRADIGNEEEVFSGGGNVGQGIFISSSGGSEVFNNTVAGQDRHGILVGEPRHGIRGNERDGWYGPVDNEVSRNVIVGSEKDKYAAALSLATSLSDADEEWEGTGRTKAELLASNPDIDVDLDQLNRSDRNVIFSGDGNPDDGRLINRATTLEDARENVFSNGTTDENSVEADPLFLDAEGGDYRLADDSPAHALRAGADPEVAGGDALIGRWRLDAVEDDEVENLSYRRADDGAVSGAAPIEGIAGGALRFDGGDVVRLPGSEEAPLLNAHGTMALWVRTGGSDAGGTILSAGGLDLAIDAAGALSLRAGDAFDGEFVSEASYDDGAWHHVAVRWTGDGTVSLLVDGAKIAEGRIGASLAEGAQGDVLLGAADIGGAAGFSGDLDEVLVYDRALEDFEIRSLRDEPEPLAAFESPVGVASTRPVPSPTFEEPDEPEEPSGAVSFAPSTPATLEFDEAKKSATIWVGRLEDVSGDTASMTIQTTLNGEATGEARLVRFAEATEARAIELESELEFDGVEIRDGEGDVSGVAALDPEAIAAGSIDEPAGPGPDMGGDPDEPVDEPASRADGEDEASAGIAAFGPSSEAVLEVGEATATTLWLGQLDDLSGDKASVMIQAVLDGGAVGEARYVQVPEMDEAQAIEFSAGGARFDVVEVRDAEGDLTGVVSLAPDLIAMTSPEALLG